jgi:drug/metabolite transporter (DMT)-like permease
MLCPRQLNFPMEVIPQRTKIILAYFIIYFVWGSTFFAVQLGLKSFPPFLFSATRLLLAGIALLIFCLVRREAFLAPSEMVRHAVCGLIVFVGGIVAVVWAQQFISSSLASAIITTPFWFIVLDKKQWAYYFSSKWILSGLVLGLFGVVILMTFKSGRAGSASQTMQTLAIVTMIIGSFFWVAGALYLKYNSENNSSPYSGTAIQLISAGLFCIGLSFISGELRTFSFDHVSRESFYALFYLAIISSLLGFLSFMWLIKVHPPAIVSTYSYVNPLVATVLGWAFASEHISTIQLIALAIILMGVLMVNIPRYQALKKDQA